MWRPWCPGRVAMWRNRRRCRWTGSRRGRSRARSYRSTTRPRSRITARCRRGTTWHPATSARSSRTRSASRPSSASCSRSWPWSAGPATACSATLSSGTSDFEASPTSSSPTSPCRTRWSRSSVRRSPYNTTWCRTGSYPTSCARWWRWRRTCPSTSPSIPFSWSQSTGKTWHTTPGSRAPWLAPVRVCMQRGVCFKSHYIWHIISLSHHFQRIHHLPIGKPHVRIP